MSNLKQEIFFEFFKCQFPARKNREMPSPSADTRFSYTLSLKKIQE